LISFVAGAVQPDLRCYCKHHLGPTLPGVQPPTISANTATSTTGTKYTGLLSPLTSPPFIAQPPSRSSAPSPNAVGALPTDRGELRGVRARALWAAHATGIVREEPEDSRVSLAGAPRPDRDGHSLAAEACRRVASRRARARSARTARCWASGSRAWLASARGVLGVKASRAGARRPRPAPVARRGACRAASSPRRRRSRARQARGSRRPWASWDRASGFANGLCEKDFNPCEVPVGHRLIIEHVSGYAVLPTSANTTAIVQLDKRPPARTPWLCPPRLRGHQDGPIRPGVNAG